MARPEGPKNRALLPKPSLVPAIPVAPANVKIQTRKLENTTDLTWSASPDGSVAGYRVLWRDTTSPNWEHVMNVGTELKANLDMSKDNVFFAVQAVDKNGHASLPVTPTPETAPTPSGRTPE